MTSSDVSWLLPCHMATQRLPTFYLYESSSIYRRQRANRRAINLFGLVAVLTKPLPPVGSLIILL